MIGFGLYAFIGNSTLSAHVYYILFVVCLMGTYLFTIHTGKLHPMGKKALALTFTAILLNILSLLAMNLCITIAHRGQPLLGLAPQQCGPFISNVLLTYFLIQLLLTIMLLIHLFHQKKNTRPGVCATLSGGFLALSYRTLLNDMNTFESFQHNVSEITMVIWGIGILGTLLTVILSKK